MMKRIPLARAAGSIPIFAALALFAARPASARDAGYRFEKIADSVADGFLEITFTGANINKHGEVAFGGARPGGIEGFFNGIYRRNKNGTLTIIAEDPDRLRFQSIADSPSINDSGEVAFGALLVGDEAFPEAILVGDGRWLTTIATTESTTPPVLDGILLLTSINKRGEVAFDARLQPFGSSLFSGSGGPLTTQLLGSSPVILDGRPAELDGSFLRPSINKHGDIAFVSSLLPSFAAGVFVGQQGRFTTIAISSGPGVFFDGPVLNDRGDVVFVRFDETGLPAILEGDGGRLRTIADTDGPFSDLKAPSINNEGDVVFFATLDDFTTSGIFTGPDTARDKVIATGDTLDGAVVIGFGPLPFIAPPLGERAINDSGQIAFIAQLDDPAAPAGVRSVIFRATPQP